VTFDFWIGDAEGRDWYDSEDIGAGWIEMRFIRDNMIKPGDVILECGAHHGCGTILLSNWVGENGKVIAFEPLPTNFDIVNKNIELNGIKNIKIENKAVGANNGLIRINGVSNSFITMSKQGIEVELIQLDDYQHMNPNFLKIDVEGFEQQVLKGAQTILRKRPKLAIELHTEMLSRYGTSVNDILNSIGIDDYNLWIQWDDMEEPEEYNNKNPIKKRVHLFCIPKNIKIP
jgi:FkbM family methyltransferase